MPSEPITSDTTSYSDAPATTEGPLPLPQESPFLSDHGMGTPAPPPGPRQPAEPPSGLSQFPPPSSPNPPAYSTPAIPSVARGTVSLAVPRPVLAPNSPAPIPGYGSVPSDTLSSFPMFLAGGGDDPFGATGRGSGALLAPATGPNDLLDRLKAVLVTTTDSLQGRLVEQYFGLVTAEALVPTDTLLEGAERTGRFSRYKTSQQKMKSLQQLVLAELKLESDKLGGNALLRTEIKTTMDHGVVLVVATGTAARVI